MSEQEIRRFALEEANKTLTASGGADPAQVLQAAKEYAAYIRGTD